MSTTTVNLTRRQFLILTVGLASGCTTVNEEGRAEGLVNAGPAGNYAADGIYGRFRDRGFFVVRKEDKLIALSSYCTHRRCKLDVEKNRSFHCPCHGSTFDPDGRVTTGPAKRDLPVFTSYLNERGELLVKVPAL